MLKRTIYIAGSTIVVKERAARKHPKGQKRDGKKKLTSEAVWRNNLREAIFNLTLILNNNFKPGDHHLQLTYKIEPTDRKAAREDLKKFTRKLRAECKKEGLPLKWVAVTERCGKAGRRRYHHHVICSYIPARIILKCWPYGHVFHNPLWDNPNYQRLASYLLKEAAALHEEEGLISKHRYSRSRNIIVPEGKEEKISRADQADAPRAFKGYFIDADSVEAYENEITQTRSRSYVMISATEKPRLKRWNRGVTVTGEYINYTKALREAYKELQIKFPDEAYI